MKIIIIAFTSILFIACNNSTNTVKPTTTAPTVVKTTRFANTKDPICDMDVEDNFTDTTIHNGKTFGFCSPTCKREAEANKAKYLK